LALPGNPGIAEVARCLPANLSDVNDVTQTCQTERVELVVIGPEAPLAIGLTDRLRAAGLRVFGPTQRAARIEASKAFSKELMQRANVPTARFLNVTSPQELEGALAELGGAVAVKADGLAAGKGVVVCSTVEEARAAGLQLLGRGPVVVEEKLIGPELSVIAITDGKHAVILPPSRDHKRLLDGDAGPNTGGMGAVCPVKISESLLGTIRETIIHRTLAAMEQDGSPFVGALFAGLMLTEQGPKALEFNARFGDPETQSIMGALPADFSLAETLVAAAEGRLHDGVVHASQSVCTVVIAAKGYPDTPETGQPITGLDDVRAAGAQVFHAGTRLVDGQLVTSGGRVLGIMATGTDLADARQKANAAARKVRLPGAQMRSDIGATST
jgi:phosphoribosylamine--glycine ligase